MENSVELFEAPVELNDDELKAVAGGLFNDINIIAAVVNSVNSSAAIVDNSSSDLEAPTP
jgi:hypothetical protein